MANYRYDILDRLAKELKGTYWEELPDLVRDLTGNFSELEPTIEHPLYLNVFLGNGWDLVLGFGDENPEMWNGLLHWYLDDETESIFFEGEITNGSPKFVVWELFDQINEKLKGANNA